MAIKSTVYKATLEIADLDRQYYATHQLTLACHPSETTRRMLTRLFIFAHSAHERLEFTKGISTDDEPDLWQKDLTNEIELWIDLGQPDERRIAKACGRSQQVRIYGYDQRAFEVWLQQKDKLARFKNLSLWQLTLPPNDELDTLLARNMHLHCTMQDENLLISCNAGSVDVSFRSCD